MVVLNERVTFEGVYFAVGAGLAAYGEADGAERRVLQERRSSSSVRGVRGVSGSGGTLSS